MNQKGLLPFLLNTLFSLVRGLFAFKNLIQLVGIRHLLGTWKRSLLAALGIGMGVMLFVAITLGNEMILSSLYNMSKQMMARADFVITAPSGGLEETLVEKVKLSPGVAHAAPMLERTLFMPEYNTYMLMLGADLLGDVYFFENQKPENMADVGDPLFLIGTTDSLLLTRTFARNYDIQPGDTVKVPTPDGQSDFTVLGLVEPKGVAKAFGGNLLLMDLGAAQVRMGAQGRIDRILVAVEPGLAPDTVRQNLQQELGPDVVVDLPGEMAKQSMKTISGFAVAMQLVSMLALLLGAFLVYNTMTISMMSRRRETGILRLVGTSRNLLLTSVMGEAIFLGILGSALGLLGGWALANGSVDLIVRNLSKAYMPIIIDPQSSRELMPLVMMLGMIMGVGTAILGSMIPAWQASRISPLKVLHGNMGDRLLAPHNYKRVILALIPLAAIIGIRCVPGSDRHLGYSTLSVILVFSIILLVTPAFMTFMLKLTARPLQRGFGILGRIAGDNIYNSLERSWINVTSLSIGICMIVAVICFIHSTRTSVITWLEQTLPADFLVSGDANLGTVTRRPMNEDILGRLRNIPNVSAMYSFRTLTAAQGGHALNIRGVDMAACPDDLGQMVLSGELPDRGKMADYPLVFINEILAREKHLSPGSSLSLRSPEGKQDFRVEAVVADFSGDQPMVYMDRAWIKRMWNDHLIDGIFISLEKGFAPALVRKEIYNRVNTGGQIFVYSALDIRNEIISALDQMFTLVKVIQSLALIVAMLGIFNTILSDIMDRAREISLLRIIGMLPSQLRKCFILEASILGLTAAFLGVGGGLITTYYLVRQMVPVIVGWTLPYRVDWPSVLQFCGMIFMVTVITGYLASYRTTREKAARV